MNKHVYSILALKDVRVVFGGGKRCPYRGVCCGRFLHFHINILGLIIIPQQCS